MRVCAATHTAVPVYFVCVLVRVFFLFFLPRRLGAHEMADGGKEGGGGICDVVCREEARAGLYHVDSHVGWTGEGGGGRRGAASNLPGLG